MAPSATAPNVGETRVSSTFAFSQPGLPCSCPVHCHGAEHRSSTEGSLLPAPLLPILAWQRHFCSANTRELAAPKK